MKLYFYVKSRVAYWIIGMSSAAIIVMALVVNIVRVCKKSSVGQIDANVNNYESGNLIEVISLKKYIIDTFCFLRPK